MASPTDFTDKFCVTGAMSFGGWVAAPDEDAECPMGLGGDGSSRGIQSACLTVTSAD
jgi:hypothetical protein